MYSFESRIRFSEIGCNQKLTLGSIVNYFQDCSFFHSDELGLGVDYLQQNKIGWLLSSWQVVVNRYPLQGEKIKVSTWPYHFKQFYGYRNFKMEDESGKVLAYANSIWIFMDKEKGRPANIPESLIEKYGGLSPKIEMEYAPRKIAVFQEQTCLEPVIVRKYHLDTNYHVNNEEYIRIAMEFLPEEFEVYQVRVEYVKSALLSEVLIPKISMEKEKYIVSLMNKENQSYAVVEFLGKETRKGL